MQKRTKRGFWNWARFRGCVPRCGMSTMMYGNAHTFTYTNHIHKSHTQISYTYTLQTEPMSYGEMIIILTHTLTHTHKSHAHAYRHQSHTCGARHTYIPPQITLRHEHNDVWKCHTFFTGIRRHHTCLHTCAITDLLFPCLKLPSHTRIYTYVYATPHDTRQSWYTHSLYLTLVRLYGKRRARCVI